MSENLKKKFFWKGKRVTEKVYNSRIRLQNVGKNLRNIYGCRNKVSDNLKECETGESEFGQLEGRRIVDLKTLAKELFCKKCDAMVSLLDTVEETRVGLASMFSVKCRSCMTIIRVATDKKHATSKENKQGRQIAHYDVNTRGAMGTLNAGIGNTHLNKLLASLNIPLYHPNTYKTHEKEVGCVVEKMAQDSCIRATVMERELTIKNIDKIKELL
ncbi:uncharacterized protein LOC120357045 [Solenopsis invicta]|uniref:uncharacterized protein LOC120357045 n=1 Tax=Solenopsis invicta TaxID=13686 RepID=UPI0005960696|nr:uncharacterized protein LOC120357045 [Solenopsis invicta]